jgi:predicted Zn-dependent protease
MRSWLLRLLAGMLALQALTGCAAMRQRLGYALVAPEVEANLGAQVAAQVEKQEKVLANAAVQEYVRTVATPLARRAQQDRPEVQFRLTVLDKPGEVNAFAAPGGYLYVYSGLLLAARDEAELAGVLAHEIGHVVARHSANQLAAQYGLELLASMALGENGPELARLAAGMGQAGVMARFSREDEMQADKLAVRYLAATGYDPDGLVSLFKILLTREAGSRTPLEQFLASHPDTQDRIRRIEIQIAKLGATTGERRQERFARATASLRR